MDHFLGLAFTLRKKGSYSNREKWNNGIYIVLENHDVCVEALKNNPLILWMMFNWSPSHSWDWDCGSKRLHKYIPWNIPWNIPVARVIKKMHKFVGSVAPFRLLLLSGSVEEEQCMWLTRLAVKAAPRPKRGSATKNHRFWPWKSQMASGCQWKYLKHFFDDGGIQAKMTPV